MIRKLLLYCVLVHIGLVSAQPSTDAQLQASGRALANYKVCAEVAEKIGDEVMSRYYADMFIDGNAQINDYTDSEATRVVQEFKLSVNKLGKLNSHSLATYCDSRFEPLTRKMQEKKLANQ